MGSLKTKLLLAYFDENNQIVSLCKTNELTCLSCGMYEAGGNILTENAQATIEEILRLKKIIQQHNCDKVRLFATHALRNAANKEWVIEQIKEKTGYDVEIIGAEEEGKLYFEATLGDFPEGQDFALVDMGGGSCQVLFGSKGDLKTSFSFKTGAQFLHETFIDNPHSPESFTTKENIEKMREHLLNEYAVLPDGLTAPLIYGSSNIIDLMKVLNIPLEPYEDAPNHPYRTHAGRLNDFLNHIIGFSHRVRDEMYPSFQTGYLWGVDKAFLNIITLSDKFNSPYILPTNASIMEGFLRKIKQ